MRDGESARAHAAHLRTTPAEVGPGAAHLASSDQAVLLAFVDVV